MGRLEAAARDMALCEILVLPNIQGFAPSPQTPPGGTHEDVVARWVASTIPVADGTLDPASVYVRYVSDAVRVHNQFSSQVAVKV